MNIKILLADDHKIVREGIRSLIEEQPDMQVVGEAKNGRAGMRLAQKLRPDVIIMDITMRDLNGIEATRQIRAENPDAKIIALSMHSDKRLVSEMLKAGASGYLLKEDCDTEELARAIRAVATDQSYLSPKIAGVVLEDYVKQVSKPVSSFSPNLTPREREVVQLFAEGRSARQISSQLNISAKTVNTHRQKIMEKLNTRSIADLTRYAIREKLISLDT